MSETVISDEERLRERRRAAMHTRDGLEKHAQVLRVKAEDARARVLAEIGALGLEANLTELESVGYTTIKGVLNADTIKRAKAAIVARVEAQTGRSIDLEHATAEDFEGMSYVPYLLYDDEVFEEILLEPRPLALMRYLLGESCLLSSLGCHFKGMGETGVVPLHSDNGNGMPSPYPPYSQVANINYALTPYSREAGALALVPGSHLWARQPSAHEIVLGGDLSNPAAISMDLAPGDAVIWHGNTWHGSYPREVPGIRMNLAAYMCRQYVQTQEAHKDHTPQDVLERHANNQPFLNLLGAKQPYGWQADGPDFSIMQHNPVGFFD
ncbi:MAG: phytanoyl-CoA dioxygenase family protein [Pseudomonadota bacterium]